MIFGSFDVEWTTSFSLFIRVQPRRMGYRIASKFSPPLYEIQHDPSLYMPILYLLPGPYTSKQRSSKALTMSLDTCPKKVAEIVACTGFENAKARSRVTRVGPALWPAGTMEELGGNCLVLRWGEFGDAGWNRQVVESVLKSGVDDDAIAYTYAYQRQPWWDEHFEAVRWWTAYLNRNIWLASYFTNIAFF